MKKAFYILIIVFAAAAVASCGEESKQSKPDSRQTAELCRRIVDLYNCYSDTLELYTDSASIDSIACIFDDRLRRLYLEFPAGLDANLSEAENDSIWRVAQRYIRLRSRMFAHPADSLVADSLPADSLPGAPARVPAPAAAAPAR